MKFSIFRRLGSFFIIVTLFFLVQKGRTEETKEKLQPRIEFQETMFDFGQIQQDQGAKHRFVFKNTGNANLIIVNLKSSCGCTAAVASTGPYAPGESGFVEISYDSRGKVGFVRKDVNVYSNDPRSPETLGIKGIVTLEEHPKRTASDVLFQGSCAHCHAFPAESETGVNLFNAVCAICHEFPQSVGKPPLSGDRMQLSQLSEQDLKEMIDTGIPRTSMPGFGQKAGGPLTQEQINSLVQYLMSLQTK